MSYTKWEAYLRNDGETWYIITVPDKPNRPHRVVARLVDVKSNELMATAHLIAAAPKMLEACKQALMHSEIPTDSLPVHVIKQLEQAITLAEVK